MEQTVLDSLRSGLRSRVFRVRNESVATTPKGSLYHWPIVQFWNFTKSSELLQSILRTLQIQTQS
jgi:hypothetical protein